MTKRGKSINLYLMDGLASGRIKCTLANWTGVAYKIPRTDLDRCKNREDLKQSGVYFLFGTSDATGNNEVYIGQAGVRKNGEGVLMRLAEHKRNPDKNYWTEAVVFTTSNNSFGPTEISYLENRFATLATNADRYEIKNGNDPTMGNITEEKESELEEFIDYAKIVMGTLGYKVFEKLDVDTEIIKDNEPNNKDNLTLYMKRKSGKSNQLIEAQCKQTNEGLVILKGSMIEVIDSVSIPPTIKELRTRSNIQGGILQESVLVKSPSYAAAFVIGGRANGLVEWKTKDGVSLKEIEERESGLL